MIDKNIDRPLKIFTSDQVHQAGNPVMVAVEKKFGLEGSIIALYTLALLMCELGLRGPEDFYDV